MATPTNHVHVGKYADKNGDKIKTNVNKAAKTSDRCLKTPGCLKAEKSPGNDERKGRSREKRKRERAPRQEQEAQDLRSSSLTSAAKIRRRRNAPKDVRRRTRKEEGTRSAAESLNRSAVQEGGRKKLPTPDMSIRSRKAGGTAPERN